MATLAGGDIVFDREDFVNPADSDPANGPMRGVASFEHATTDGGS